MSYEYKLLATDSLLATENIDACLVKDLTTEIQKSGLWRVPILVLYEKPIILDGHHRTEAAKCLNLLKIPAIVVKRDNPHLKVQSWRKDYSVTIDDLIRNVNNSILLPIKTTRFIFELAINEVSIPLSNLSQLD